MSYSSFVLPSFFFTATATTEIYTLSLHDALPILDAMVSWMSESRKLSARDRLIIKHTTRTAKAIVRDLRSEEHTSELQSHHDLVCRLLLEKKKKNKKINKPKYNIKHILSTHKTLK